MPPKKIFPKDIVKKAFAEGGADAARKMANKIAEDGMEGAARAPSQVDRWLREWEATPPTPSPAKPASEPRKASEIEKAAERGSRRRMSKIVEEPKRTGKRRVYDIGEPNIHGTVLTEGEQVSTVKWDVPVPWGKESHTSNEKLKDVESEPSQHERKIFFSAIDFSVVRPNGLIKKGPKGLYREDETITVHKTFAKAIAAANDDRLWVFARTKGGTVSLLMRPHWEQYRRLEEARKEQATEKDCR